MIRRPARRLPASLAALVLLGACAIVATSCLQVLLGRRPLLEYRAIAAALHATRWSDLPVALGGGVAVLVGLVLLALAVTPGRPTVLPLAPTSTAVDSGAARRGLRRTLQAAAGSVDGVRAVRLTVRRKRIDATVRTNRTVTDGLAEEVRAALDRRLGEIAPATRPLPRVRVRSSRSPR
jgi:hypothetical protein